MFWTILSAVASIIALFAFITGIASLPQLREALRNRTLALPRPISRATRPDDRAHVYFAPRHLFYVFACGLLIAAVAYNTAAPSSIKWIPAPLRSTWAMERAVVAGLITLGLSFTCLVMILRWKGISDPGEFGVWISLPAFGALVGLIAGVTQGIMFVPMGVACFTGFLALPPLALVVFVEVGAAAYQFVRSSGS